MKIIIDNLCIADFDAWSGAIETKEAIIEAGKCDEFNSYIEEVYPEGLSDTQLNDLLWFESDYIFDFLGIEIEE